MNWIDRIPSWGIEIFGLLFCWSFIAPMAIWKMNNLPETDCMTGDEFAFGMLMFIGICGGAVFLQSLGEKLWKRFKNRKKVSNDRRY